MPVIWASLGLVVGVFLDLLIRGFTTAREDTAKELCPACGPAHCDRRLVPLIGVLVAPKCPECGRRRWQASLALQLGTAAAFGALAWRVPADPSLLVLSLYAAILIVVFTTDVQHRLIFDVVTLPSMLLAPTATAILNWPDPLAALGSALFGGFFAGAFFLGVFVLATLLYRRSDAFGMGDVKLALVVGLMTGWPGAMAAILLGSVLGAILGLGLMVRARSRAATMPYGTALVLGALGSILWRPPL